MEIKLRGRRGTDIVRIALENRGIMDMDLYLNPNNSNETSFQQFRNMFKAVQLYRRHIDNKSAITILVDDDIDGLTSASLMRKACIALGAKVTMVFHRENKERNLSDTVIEDVMATGCQLLIVPDAGSNDIEGQNILNDYGVDVLVLDHHKVTTEDTVANPDRTVVVNSNFQIDENHTEELTGVGVVYKFLEALELEFERDFTSDVLDIVAFGLISDSSDYSCNQIRHIVFEGLKKLNNPLIKELLKKKLDRGEEITPIDISYKVSPFMNAVYRIGTVYDKEQLFNTFNGIGFYEKETAKRRYKDESTGKFKFRNVEINRYESYVKKLKKFKEAQNELMHVIFTEALDNINPDGGITISVLPTKEGKAVSGLVAQRLLDSFGRPAIFLVDKGEYYQGSLRAKRGFDMNKWCNETGYCVAQGHDVACGIKIKKEDLNKFIECTKELDREMVYYTDYLESDITKEMIEDIYDNRGLFGGSIEPPLIGLQNTRILKDDIEVFSKVIKINMGGYEISIFGNVQQIGRELMAGFSPVVKVDLVGEASINEFKGKLTPQITVREIALSKEGEEDKYFF